MTLQIAMAGQGGWVLASDRMRLEIGDSASVRTSSTITKIVHTNQLAYASAGSDEVGFITGREMVAALANGNLSFSDLMQFADDLRKLANKVWRRVARNLKRAYRLDPSHTARGIIICFAHFPTFLSLGIGRDSVPTCLGRMAIFGDTTNAAKFFPRRYYSPTTSLDHLTLIAAHMILIGSMLNPDGVGGGVDIVVCENGTIRPLSEDEVSRLERRSSEIDAILDRLFRE